MRDVKRSMSKVEKDRIAKKIADIKQHNSKNSNSAQSFMASFNEYLEKDMMRYRKSMFEEEPWPETVLTACDDKMECQENKLQDNTVSSDERALTDTCDTDTLSSLPLVEHYSPPLEYEIIETAENPKEVAVYAVSNYSYNNTLCSENIEENNSEMLVTSQEEFGFNENDEDSEEYRLQIDMAASDTSKHTIDQRFACFSFQFLVKKSHCSSLTFDTVTCQEVEKASEWKARERLRF